MKKKIIWIASYPKSGNTWFRAFLTALFQNGQIDINDLYSNLIYSSKAIFESETDLAPNLLYYSESKKMIPNIFGQIADSVTSDLPLLIKVHNHFQMLENGLPFLPIEQTKCIIYIIRNPLDVSVSLANHLEFSIDKTIDFLNNQKSELANQLNNFNSKKQFPQYLGSWSDHVESWATQKTFPTLIIRYEDLIVQPELYFEKAIKFMGLNFSKTAIQNAVNETRFEKLQEQEKTKTFKENPNVNKLFFNSGKSGNWINALSRNQIKKIVSTNKKAMQKFNYL